jgi:putative transposase
MPFTIVYLDCIMLKIRHDKRVINKAVYLDLGINLEGQKELLGIWMAETEGAKFWLNVLTELQNRGSAEYLIACVDGLSGFPDAINTVHPNAKVQLCIVHLVRNVLKHVSWKELKVVYLATQAASKKWTMPIRNSKSAMNRFMIEFEEQLAPHI